ncbi:hypothetical protein PP640_gp31 [Arthrobacter phage Faja]|uniref:Uncharacterized protein n=1 Tax=Arthrobacter phage Faja TaxID=2419957 RepID=A0A3G2KFW7_9CAUD|nr:hypothetical protein PP640_gp31 [Arthrobacter phage Faja]AYN57884.1 hypothetical protein PBI_FAJA_31 [Arthrobacter phage Faja]
MAYMKDFKGSRLDDFVPSRDVPSILAWFDASTLSGANGQALTVWAASFGAFSFNLTPATKPTLLTNAANGKNAVRFAPSSYFRNTDVFGAGGLGMGAGYTQPFSFTFVARVSSDIALTGNTLLMGSSTATVRLPVQGLTYYANAGSDSTIFGPPVNDGTWHVVTVNFGVGGATTYIDGYLATVAPAQVGTASLGNLFVGPGLGAAPSAGTFDVAELIVANTVLSPSRIDAIHAHLATKWGIS